MSVQRRFDTGVWSIRFQRFGGAGLRELHPKALAPDTSKRLEIVPDPDREARLPEPLAPGRPLLDALVSEDVVFVVLVEQRAPGPVEVNGETEREGFQPDP